MVNSDIDVDNYALFSQPLRPNSLWGTRKKGEPTKPASTSSSTKATLAVSMSAADVPSKHMSKKAKKAARKEAKVCE